MLNVRPWEWALMTAEDADALLDWLDAYEQAQTEAEQKARR